MFNKKLKQEFQKLLDPVRQNLEMTPGQAYLRVSQANSSSDHHDALSYQYKL